MTQEGGNAIDLDDMPKSLREFAQSADIEAAVNLSRRFGGRYIYVPMALHHEHELVQAIGMDAARILSATWGSDYMYVPEPKFLDRSRRNAEIRRLHVDGMAVQGIADRYGISTRQVWRICESEDCE